MSEMIDRVAAAILAARPADPTSSSLGTPEQAARAYARVAVEAMREPTDAMEWAGDEAAQTCVKDDPCGKAGRHVWADMMDEALKE